MSRAHSTAILPGEEAGAEVHRHSDEKARQILDGARAVFLRDGFDAASMNDIARAAGVSKGTLYVYFQSKDQLFAALVRSDKRQQAEQTCHWTDLDELGDARTVLGGLGRRFLRKITDPYNVAQVRTVMAVAPKFPDIGRAFWETGPAYGLVRLSEVFDRLVAAGRLAHIPDTHLAASHFINMCQGDAIRRLMLCVETRIDDEVLAATVDSAVDFFMRAYGPAETVRSE